MRGQEVTIKSKRHGEFHQCKREEGEPVPEVVPEVAVQRTRRPRKPGVEIDPAGGKGSSWRMI